uniref:Uncharacterized protein n=1 Tax=Amphora coffeiformis TaxID=265554 RepID=A0A7S3L6P1_9STRA|mmetsp:Transcript_10202/g.19579  ORF Transcript_10202/g.19579 Transcript_10202/m.19579 type:complete len:115 (+) Transcript_10202:561-905(+)
MKHNTLVDAQIIVRQHEETRQSSRQETVSSPSSLSPQPQQPRDETWLQSLCSAYQGFRQASTVEAVQGIVHQHQMTKRPPVSATGLEKWAVRNMAIDRVQRRRDFWKCVHDIQQ